MKSNVKMASATIWPKMCRMRRDADSLSLSLFFLWQIPHHFAALDKCLQLSPHTLLHTLLHTRLHTSLCYCTRYYIRYYVRYYIRYYIHYYIHLCLDCKFHDATRRNATRRGGPRGRDATRRDAARRTARTRRDATRRGDATWRGEEGREDAADSCTFVQYINNNKT